MRKCLKMIIWLAFVTQKVISIKCAECNYLPHSSISGIRTCPKNCYGDICFIVVNNYHNETLISGCVNVDGETQAFFRNQSYCYKKVQYTVCGCTVADRCNSPQAPLSMFTFITTPFFKDCQFVPNNGDTGCNSLQDNITLKENNSQVELSQPKENGRSVNVTETTTENVDRLSAVIESTTSYPTVSYSIKSIKLINEENEYYGDGRNEISSEFIDEVMHGLLPSTDFQRFLNTKFDYNKLNEAKMNEKINIEHYGNSCNSQYGTSRITVLLISSLLTYFFQLPELKFKKGVAFS